MLVILIVKNIIETPIGRAMIVIILAVVIGSIAYIIAIGFSWEMMIFFIGGGAITLACCFVLEKIARMNGEKNGRTT